ncbi:hypothetical protein HAX54_017020 [Datura stramonium]|uniref:Uncharacterized protein n=1 Tax=Datura stramonium TaxID=4076 RepID=A0ABS8S0C2_DATST|nr:hypothetical protein [Datura stramonium]
MTSKTSGSSQVLRALIADVLHHIIVRPRLMVLVDLLNQQSVPVQHRLHLLESVREVVPHLGVAFLHIEVSVYVPYVGFNGRAISAAPAPAIVSRCSGEGLSFG